LPAAAPATWQEDHAAGVMHRICAEWTASGRDVADGDNTVRMTLRQIEAQWSRRDQRVNETPV
jgi:hypothetical protein